MVGAWEWRLELVRVSVQAHLSGWPLALELEIEFSVISCRSIGQRHPDEDSLRWDIHAVEQERNESQSVINWCFTTQDARTKLHRLYPLFPA